MNKLKSNGYIYLFKYYSKEYDYRSLLSKFKIPCTIFVLDKDIKLNYYYSLWRNQKLNINHFSKNGYTFYKIITKLKKQNGELSERFKELV